MTLSIKTRLVVTLVAFILAATALAAAPPPSLSNGPVSSVVSDVFSVPEAHAHWGHYTGKFCGRSHRWYSVGNRWDLVRISARKRSATTWSITSRLYKNGRSTGITKTDVCWSWQV